MGLKVEDDEIADMDGSCWVAKIFANDVDADAARKGREENIISIYVKKVHVCYVMYVLYLRLSLHMYLIYLIQRLGSHSLIAIKLKSAPFLTFLQL